MNRELLQTLGADFTYVEDGGSSQFGATHILRSHESYFLALILTNEVSRGIPDISTFLRASAGVLGSDGSTTSLSQSGMLPGPEGRLFLVIGPFFEPIHTAHHQLTLSVLSAADAAQTGGRLCAILQLLHDSNQVHGAITPSSVLLGGSGTVWLTQIGISKALNDLGLNTAHLPPTLQSRYGAPEQLTRASSDHRADIYSVGAILYELVTGKPPFGGRTTATVMANILTDGTTPQKAADAQASEHVVDAILRAIEKDPEDRWSTARQFGAALGDHGNSEILMPAERPKSGCLGRAAVLGISFYVLLHIFA